MEDKETVCLCERIGLSKGSGMENAVTQPFRVVIEAQKYSFNFVV